MEGAPVLASERYGSEESWRYSWTDDGELKRHRTGSGSSQSSVIAAFKSVFLPQGYPDSVSGDYLQYQLWDTVQAFSSTLSGTLATQASLRGVGVGNQQATVAAATVTWILKDGTGMLGRILFAWLKGSKLDSDAKKWRLFADVLNDVAMFMEILAPYFPASFTLVVCAAGIFKSIVGVAGGATRAALTVHQARRDNMADISAKDGSQETLVNLAGLLLSLILVPLIVDNPVLIFTLFFLFTVLHLFANYKAVSAVVMETFNEARLSIVLHQYLTDRRLLSPTEANRREPVFLDFRKTVSVKLGVKLQDLIRSPEELNLSLKKNHTSYLVGVRDDRVCVCLRPDVSPRDEIRAACQAVWLRAKLSDARSRKPQTDWDLVHESHELMDLIFDPFIRGVEAAGWITTRTLMDRDEWRVEWKTKTN